MTGILGGVSCPRAPARLSAPAERARTPPPGSPPPHWILGGQAGDGGGGGGGAEGISFPKHPHSDAVPHQGSCGGGVGMGASALPRPPLLPRWGFLSLLPLPPLASRQEAEFASQGPKTPPIPYSKARLTSQHLMGGWLRGGERWDNGTHSLLPQLHAHLLGEVPDTGLCLDFHHLHVNH